MIYMLTKTSDYYCDKYAVTEPMKSINRADENGYFTGNRHHTNAVDAARLTNRDNRESMNRVSPYGRNKWDVWEMSTSGYPGSHYAVFPDELPEICIKAATSEAGCCTRCGAPWARGVEKGELEPLNGNPNPVLPYSAASKTQANGRTNTTLHMKRTINSNDWRPTCDCGETEPAPCRVLDIFAGSGTTVMVANRLGRIGVGVDLSMSYLQKDAMERTGLRALRALQHGHGIKSAPIRKRPKKTPAAQMSLLDRSR